MKIRLTIFLVFLISYEVIGQTNEYKLSLVTSDQFDFIEPTIDELIFFRKFRHPGMETIYGRSEVHM